MRVAGCALTAQRGYSLKMYKTEGHIVLFLLTQNGHFSLLLAARADLLRFSLLMHAGTHQTVSYCSAVRLDVCLEVKSFQACYRFRHLFIWMLPAVLEIIMSFSKNIILR